MLRLIWYTASCCKQELLLFCAPCSVWVHAGSAGVDVRPGPEQDHTERCGLFLDWTVEEEEGSSGIFVMKLVCWISDLTSASHTCTHTSYTHIVLGLHTRPVTRQAVSKQISSKKPRQSGRRQCYLTRRALRPVTWYYFEGYASSHVPLWTHNIGSFSFNTWPHSTVMWEGTNTLDIWSGYR